MLRRACCWQRAALGNSSLQQSRDSTSSLDFNSLSLTPQQFVSHVGKAKGSRGNTSLACFTSLGPFSLHTQHFLPDKTQQFWPTKPPFLAARLLMPLSLPFLMHTGLPGSADSEVATGTEEYQIMEVLKPYYPLAQSVLFFFYRMEIIQLLFQIAADKNNLRVWLSFR